MSLNQYVSGLERKARIGGGCTASREVASS